MLFLCSKALENLLANHHDSAMAQSFHDFFYIHKDRIDEIDENEIAKTFIGENVRRRHYFGNI